METAYEARDVTRFAAWVHETDEALRADLERRGYTVDKTTRAMGMPLADILVARPELELGSAGWDDYLRIFGLPARLLGGADHSVFYLLFARLEGESVAAAMAFDHEGDCGIYNVGTLEHARRRGLATALTAVHAARCRRTRMSRRPACSRRGWPSAFTPPSGSAISG